MKYRLVLRHTRMNSVHAGRSTPALSDQRLKAAANSRSRSVRLVPLTAERLKAVANSLSRSVRLPLWRESFVGDP